MKLWCSIAVDIITDMAKAITGIFCRTCEYDLQALAENRCPECGREFDPGERRSYDLKPRRRALRRWAWGLSLLALLALVAAGGTMGWLYRGWDHDRQALAQLKRHGIIREEVAAMPVMERLLPQRWQYLRTRVWSVCLDSKKLTPEEWAMMERMEYLRDARLGLPAGSDMQHLARLKGLSYLQINSKEINDANLANIESLSKLGSLSLTGGRMSDAGIAHLKKLPVLESLSLYNVELDDRGLMSLAQLAALRQLRLDHPPSITEEGIQQFKAARPDVVLRQNKR